MTYFHGKISVEPFINWRTDDIIERRQVPLAEIGIVQEREVFSVGIAVDEEEIEDDHQQELSEIILRICAVVHDKLYGLFQPRPSSLLVFVFRHDT